MTRRQATFQFLQYLAASPLVRADRKFSKLDAWKGGSPSPWYTQVLLAPVLGLAALGLER